MDPVRLIPFSIWVLLTSCNPGAETFTPSTPCEQFCVDLGDRIEGELATSLASKGANPSCSTDTPALEGCAMECESKGPSQDCMDCMASSGNGCRQFCMGTSLSDTQFFIAMGLECWFGARPNDQCADSSVATVRGTIENRMPNFQLDYAGTATVASLVPLSLGLPDGQVVTINSPAATMGLAIGDAVDLQAQVSCPWWCASAYVVRSTRGGLLQAGWSGREPLPIAEFTLNYELAQCVGNGADGQRAIDLSLIVDNAQVLVGDSLESQGFRIHNGRSFDVYASWVTDSPSVWYEGLIEPM